MWPLIITFGRRFSNYLVLPIAAVIGTIGYYAEKKFAAKPKTIDYLHSSIQEQREQRLAEGGLSTSSLQIKDRPKLPDTLGLLKPKHEE